MEFTIPSIHFDNATMVNMDLWIPNGLWIHHQATWEDSSENWMTVNDTERLDTILLTQWLKRVFWEVNLPFSSKPLPEVNKGPANGFAPSNLGKRTTVSSVPHSTTYIYIYIYNNKCYKPEIRCAPRIAGAVGIYYKVPSGSQTEWRFWLDWENHRTRWWLSSGPPRLMAPEVVFFFFNKHPKNEQNGVLRIVIRCYKLTWQPTLL